MQPTQPSPSVPGEVARTLGAYLTGQLKIAGILSVIYAVGFALARMPFGLLLGLLCGAVNQIPIAGPLLVMGIAGFALLMGEADLWQYLTALGVFVLVQALEGFVLTPRILGRRLKMSPLWVFFLLIAGSSLFGFVGGLVAVPVGAVVLVLWRALERRRSRAA